MKKGVKNLKNTKSEQKGFVWYSLRISFLLMFLFFIISLSLPLFLTLLINLLFIISLLFTFVVSIIHLFKFKRKVFPIVALVISVLFILFYIIGLANPST
ncbi:MAG: hypothetical protein AABY06_01540 [Nanoarchaeota archaeon]